MDHMLEMRVRAEYPTFFVKRGDRVSDVAIATGDGWYPIFISLFRALSELAAYSSASFMGLQVKEKFGRMRVYFSNHNIPDSDALALAYLFVDTAEFLSGCTCEICGAAGSLTKVNHWVRVRCAQHVNDREPSVDDLPQIVSRLLDAPIPVLDCSLLPPQGRLETSPDERDSRLRLSLITYRSMQSYLGARVSDIEISQEIGWFESSSDAVVAAQKHGCTNFKIRSPNAVNSLSGAIGSLSGVLHEL